MREDLIVPDEKDERAALPSKEVRDRVIIEPFTPLRDRIGQERPDMLPALLKLEELIGPEDFSVYIDTLQNIRRNDATVMLITENALHKTTIEAKFLPRIEEAFGVNFVRVVCLG